MPTGPSSADPGTPGHRAYPGHSAYPGPVRSLVLLLRLRTGSLTVGQRVGLGVGVLLMVGLTVGSVVLPPRLTLEPELVEAMGRYLPAGFLAFVLTTATAVLFSGGGREALPADQVVAFPVGPTTDHLAGLVMAPLNLAWLLQTWTLVATVSILSGGGHQGAALLPVVLWLLAGTAVVQLLSWLVEDVRRGPRGELVVRTVAGLLFAGLVALVATGHLLDVTAWTPAGWAASLTERGAAGDWLPWALGCLALAVVTVAAVLLGARAARRTWRRPATTQARVETRRYPPRAFPRSDLRALVALDRAACGARPRSVGGSSCSACFRSSSPSRAGSTGSWCRCCRGSWPPVGRCSSGSTPGPSTRAVRSGARACPCGRAPSCWPGPGCSGEVLAVAAVATLLICGVRAGMPRSAELSAAVGAMVVVVPAHGGLRAALVGAPTLQRRPAQRAGHPRTSARHGCLLGPARRRSDPDRTRVLGAGTALPVVVVGAPRRVPRGDLAAQPLAYRAAVGPPDGAVRRGRDRGQHLSCSPGGALRAGARLRASGETVIGPLHEVRRQRRVRRHDAHAVPPGIATNRSGRPAAHRPST